MAGIVRICLAICLFLAGCTSLSQPGSNLSTDTILLDQVNPLARSDPDWFSAGKQCRHELTPKYTGKLKPEIAVYLENDIYLYEDERLKSYILQIIDRLLQNWQGPHPTIEVVLETGKYFSAYVDELHQLHVTTGLLRELENEDQLASVIAHELSHVLLRHNSEKSFAERVGTTFEVGAILMVSGGLNAEALTGEKNFREKGQEGSLGLESLGFVWADMLIPSWSRENEREADMLGLDLLIRADYNYEQFQSVMERIADAAIQRSERLERFNKRALALIEKNKKNIKTSFGGKVDRFLQDMGVAAEKLIVEQATSGIASWNKSHDDRAERIDALKTYLMAAHQGGDLPPEASTAVFEEIVGNPASRARLKKDLAAIEAIDALREGNVSLAASKLAGMEPKSMSSPISCCIAKSLLEKSRKRPETAAAALDGLVRNTPSPAEAYLQLAEIHAARRHFTQADASLKLGVETIGRDYKFLPLLIHVNVRAGNIPAAEEFALRCRQYDDGVTHSLKRFGLHEDDKETYYQKCVKILGYDVAQRRDGADSSRTSTGFGRILQKVSPFSR